MNNLHALVTHVIREKHGSLFHLNNQKWEGMYIFSHMPKGFSKYNTVNLNVREKGGDKKGKVNGGSQRLGEG